jgi:predicted ATPase
VRSNLPSGTVTFLFTDVEGSTKLLHELGAEEYARELAEHRRILRDAFDAHGGVEVDTQGDAFFFAFPTAEGALQSASRARQGLAEGPIRVRTGIHTGTPHLADEGYVGVDVHRAARIASAGHGGQVLVSGSTAALLGTGGLRDLGEHRLKDLSAPERIYQVGEEAFPPLKSLYQTNLPIPSTPFLGRERELEEVLGLLSQNDIRLLTLTGTGGTGKTRLGLQAAGGLADRYPDGIWWVPLAPLRDPELVLATAGPVVGARNGVGEHIGDRSVLLLFDNFEHVVEAAADLAALLSSCPNLDLLVTSREPLHVTGEQEYAVPPLAHDEGVDFFLARARAVRPEFESDEAASEICRRLDGLPLALELAAARVKALSSAQILERLEQRLPLLTGGARDLPERQRTLRATIQWSYELLSSEEQHLFARLAVFRGGCTLEAAEQVAEADVDTLQSLVDKSLIRRWDGGRYAMLETVHEFAQERFDSADDAADTRRRHALHLLQLAEEAELHVEGAEQMLWLERLDEELNNLREALAFAAAEGDDDFLLRMTRSLTRFWSVRGYLAEGRMWFERALQSASREGVRSRRARRGAAWLAFLQGDVDGTERLALAGLEDAEREGDGADAAYFLRRLGDVAQEREDYEGGLRRYGESVRVLRDLGDKDGLAASLSNLGDLELAEGHVERATELFGESLALMRQIGQPEGIVINVQNLGLVALLAGRTDDAADYLAESLVLARQLGDARCFGEALEALGAVAADRGDEGTAASLLGVAERLREESGNSLHRVELAVHERTVAMLGDRLGVDVVAASMTQGRHLDVDEAVRLALAVAES